MNSVKTLFIILTAVSAIVLQACATSPAEGNNLSASGSASNSERVELGRVVEQPLTLIASDLAGALLQVLNKQGSGSTVKVPPIDSTFGRVFKNVLESKGISVENTNFGRGQNVVKTRSFPVQPSGIQSHGVYLGDIALIRSYSVENNKVTPRSSLLVSGIDASQIKLDDRIFLPGTYRQKAGPGDLYLCTPQGKGVTTDGWVCRRGKNGKQWIDAVAHATLINRGVPVVATDWEQLMSKPDTTIIESSRITGKNRATLPDGTFYLCTPDGKGAGTDGWLCRAGQSGKQWLSIAERAKLVKKGVPVSPIDWEPLMAMQSVEWSLN